MATTATFDPTAYKESTRAQWQAAAEAWHRWGPFLRQWLGPATEVMLDMAGVRSGSRVLDVAAGAGEQTITAARRVGPTGYVLAIDISSNLLALAAQDARSAGLTNIETRVMDGENLDLEDASFDAVISRVGLIYFPDQQRALREMLRVLKPGGRVAAIVYSTPENNGFFSIPVSVIRRRAQLPPPLPGQPGPFSLGGPGVLEAAYLQAGLREPDCRAVSAPLAMASATECVRFERESFGALHQMLSGLSNSEREATWQEIERQLSSFEGPNGFEGPCELIVGGAVRPLGRASTTTGDLYIRAMESTQRIVDRVPADRWHAPTPCSEWNARQVANHIIGENLWAAELFQGKTIAEVGSRLDGDLTADDPAAAYRQSVEVARKAVETPGAMAATCHLSFGDYAGAEYAKQLFLDALIHGWDIAKGTGQDTHLDPELVSACLPIAEELTRQFRAAGVFGADLPVRADADPQVKLLALVGRMP